MVVSVGMVVTTARLQGVNMTSGLKKKKKRQKEKEETSLKESLPKDGGNLNIFIKSH